MKQQKNQLSNSIFVIGCIAIISVLFAAVQIQQSVFSGQLALPITYDDIVYFTGALRRLNRFYEDGLARLFLDFIQAPPHSPTSTSTSLLGFILFGRNDWAPAAANTVWLFAFLCFVTHITSGLSNFYRIVIFIIALTSPITGHLIIESRPDILAGLSIACGVFLILRSNSLEKKKPLQFLAGSMIALSFLAKPSISPITTIILLSTLVLKAFSIYLRYHFETPDQVDKKRNLLISGIKKIVCILTGYTTLYITVLALIFPHYILSFKTIFYYIYSTVFGEGKEFWYFNGSLSEHFLYYITGKGGRMMFGDWRILIPLVFLLTLGIAIAKRDWRSLKASIPYIGVLFITFALVTIPATKSPFLGMAFGSMVLLSVLHLIGYAAQTLEFQIPGARIYRTGYRFICIVLAVISLSLFQWPWHSKGKPSDIQMNITRSSYEQELIDLVSQELKGKLIGSTPACSPYINLVTYTLNLTPDVLEYTLLKQGISNFVVSSNIMSTDFSDTWKKITESDYVIAFSADYPGVAKWYPGNKFIPQILENIEENDNLTLLKSFPRPEALRGGEVFLYSSAQQPCKPIPPQVLLR